MPSYYNLYDEGLLTPVKDQQSGGNCWGFSAIAALESSILKVANLTFDYSEENMKNLIEIYSAYGWKMDTNQGGYDNMAIGYLTSWLGPIFEVNDTYDDYSTLSTVLDSVLHIQDVFYVPARSNYTDNDAIKHAILKYGAVSASYYHSSSYYNPLTYGYYYPGIGGGNHAITIIGWDDNYSKDNFYYTPAGDGAFIIKNSWNETWGEDGFFYISYYDGILYAVGNPQACYGFILTNDNNYTKNYQYDFAGLTDYLITGKSTMWYANEFNSTSNEYIAAFSTYFNSTTDWEAEIYVNGYLKHTQNGTSSSGYHTIDLDELVSVNIGDTFRISLKITSARYAIIPISEAVSTTRTYYKPGVSFMSFNGKSWIDLYDYQFKYSTHTYTSQVACIKAFTFDRPNTNTTIDVGDVKSNVGNIFNVIANVMDNDGNLVNYGFVNFTIDNNTYSIRVSNGIANLTFSFNQTGEYEVIAKYWALEGFNPSNTTANINITKMPISLNLTIDNIIYGDKVVAHIQSNADDLKLTIAGKTYDVNSTEFILPYILDAGEYVAVLSYDGSDKYLSNSTTAKFNVGVKIINMSTTVNNLTLEIKLSENINATVSILIDNMSQRVNIVNGMANVNVSDLKYGNHSYEVKFSDKNYNNIINEGVIEINNINVVIIAPDVTKYFAGPQRFVINITDGDGNPISGLDMIISINGGLYKRTSDENGTASIAINLNSGEYEVGVVINATGDYTAANNTSKVTVLPTIEANDLTKVFRNASQYRATFKDSEGNLIKNTTVSFNINGIYYNRTTDDEGVAQLNINLEQGTYILTAINPLNGEMHTNIVNVTSRLIENNDLVKFYKNESQFKVLLIGDDGNPAGAGESVSFNINGIFYTKASDENGYVTLNINLYPGEYIMTTEYKGCRVANTIKVLPVLSGNDITMNYGDGTQFEATLLDGQGKAYPNREITFNINGVFYTRTTDNDGIAHLNINLMSGEYIITSIYNGVNVANKITII